MALANPLMSSELSVGLANVTRSSLLSLNRFLLMLDWNPAALSRLLSKNTASPKGWYGKDNQTNKCLSGDLRNSSYSFLVRSARQWSLRQLLEKNKSPESFSKTRRDCRNWEVIGVWTPSVPKDVMRSNLQVWLSGRLCMSAHTRCILLPRVRSLAFSSILAEISTAIIWS